MLVALLIMFVLAIVVVAGIGQTLRRNANLLQAVEEFDEHSGAARDAVLIDLHRLFDRPADDWTPVLDRDGIRVATSWSSQALAGGAGVRTYRTVSYLCEDEIPIERMLSMLDGGFLREEVWFKGDFIGGACLETLDCPAGQSAWIAQYISDMKPLRPREFVYLLFRRELLSTEFSRYSFWKNERPTRQVCIAYRSVARPRTAGRVRAIQYPALDRISLHADGVICWEHIMAFHIAGTVPLWLNNRLVGPSAEVLYQEAANMRKHVLPLSTTKTST